MSEEQPKNEDERREFAFTIALGEYVMEKERDGVVTFDFDPAVVRRFFQAGWGWGKVEAARTNDEIDIVISCEHDAAGRKPRPPTPFEGN